MYRGRQVLDVAAQNARKEERRKAKLRARGEDVGTGDTAASEKDE